MSAIVHKSITLFVLLLVCCIHMFFFFTQFSFFRFLVLSNYRFTCLRIPCRDFVLPYNCRTTKYIKVNYFVRKSINFNNTGVVVDLRNNCTRTPDLRKLNSRRGRAKPNLFDINATNTHWVRTSRANTRKMLGNRCLVKGMVNKVVS